MKHSTSSFSRFIPILLVIVIMLVSIGSVVAIWQAMSGGDGNSQVSDAPINATAADDARTALLSTDSNRAVRLTVRGPIVANEKFRSYHITASPSSRYMITYEGYLETPITEKKYDNNHTAYEQLVYALDKRKMMTGRELKPEQNDLRGICASGKVYLFETIVDDKVDHTLWTSDCSGSKGSAVANVEEIVDMFMKQIPDGNALATKVGLQQQDTFFKL